MPYRFRTLTLLTLLALVCAPGSLPASQHIAKPAGGEPPPPQLPPGPELPVNGSEHLEWDQLAASVDELGGLGFVVYVDGVALEASNVSCASEPGDDGFACRSPLPTMEVGSHTLEVAAVKLGEDRFEGPRSSAIRVRLESPGVTGSYAERPVPALAEGLTLSRYPTDISDPSDIAVLPDGSLLLAAKSGAVYLTRGHVVAPEPALVLDDVMTQAGQGLLALAVDRQFTQSRAVFVLYTTGRGARVARYTWAGDRLGSRAIILEGLPLAAAQPRATMRMGPDGKLYIAFNVSDSGRRMPSGEVLRVNADGTTPDDQPAGAPTIIDGLVRPVGLAWGAEDSALWVVSSGLGGTGELAAMRPTSGAARRRPVARFSLPGGAGASSFTAHRDPRSPIGGENLLVGTLSEPGLLRIGVGPGNQVAESEWWLRGLPDPIISMTVTPDGVVYAVVPRGLMRIDPRSH